MPGARCIDSAGQMYTELRGSRLHSLSRNDMRRIAHSGWTLGQRDGAVLAVADFQDYWAHMSVTGSPAGNYGHISAAERL